MTAQDNGNSDLKGGSRGRTRQPGQVNKMQVRANALIVTGHKWHPESLCPSNPLCTFTSNAQTPSVRPAGYDCLVVKSDCKAKIKVDFRRSPSVAPRPGRLQVTAGRAVVTATRSRQNISHKCLAFPPNLYRSCEGTTQWL